MKILAATRASRSRPGYRYLHEAIDVIAAHAPDLPAIVAQARKDGWTHRCLDGTLIPTARPAAS